MSFAPAGTEQIHYQDTGRGPALVLLNGWTASGLSWPRAWVAELEKRFRVLRIDNRGTGWSARPEAPFTMEDMAADAVAVLDTEGIDRATVLGLSMGGMIAQTLALAHRARVSALVLAATAPPIPEMVAAGPEVFQKLLSRPPDGGRDEWIASLWAGVVGPGFPERGAQILAELVEDSSVRPTAQAVIMMQAQALAGFEKPERLASIDCPTAVVHGGDDPLLPVENGRRLARLVPGASYTELPGVGHLVPWEAPDATLRVLAEVAP